MRLEGTAARPPLRVVCAGEKLAARGRLPGAHGYDQAAHAVRLAAARGITAETLLPLLLPTSWMVNAPASSRVFQAWLSPPLLEAWGGLLELLDPGMSAADVAGASEEERRLVSTCVGALAAVPGSSLSAVSKVLALARPAIVPLMDDAAIALALGTLPRTLEKATATASPELFLPMVSWFARAIAANEAELAELARGHEGAVLDAAQVLDRLLWFDSFGYAEVTGWGWIEDAGVAAVVPSRVPPREKGARLPIEALHPDDRARAEALLSGGDRP
jgi:hypothetical protein